MAIRIGTPSQSFSELVSRKSVRAVVALFFLSSTLFLVAKDYHNTQGWTLNIKDPSSVAPKRIGYTKVDPSQQHQQQGSHPVSYGKIPLENLINTDPDPVCIPGDSSRSLLESVILSENVTYSSHRKIPKIVHVTSRTRCMTPAFIKNLELWKFPGYSFYVHDDAAVDRLLRKYWPEFPHLQLLQHCMISGAAKADLWRYLILWEYGGIYTDIDNAPGPLFGDGNVIKDDDDAWFLVERIGVLSQYFMAASPRHPLLHIAVIHCLDRLLDVTEIGKQYVPFVTGPGVTKSAMIFFMKNESDAYVTSKVYVGIDGRSVTVRGTRQSCDQWVKRESLSSSDKHGGYAEMGMKHFSQVKDTNFLDSCYEVLYKVAVKLKSNNITETTNGKDE